MTIEEAKKQLRELILDREDRERILDTENLKVSDSIKEIYRKDIEALKKALELFEKQIPKKPTEYDSVPHARCPQCTRGVRVYCDSAKVPFCQWCGQALDWSEKIE